MRPPPCDGTYEDAKSCLAGGDTIVFTRSLDIQRNSVVLPVGYELESVNYPSQVIAESDGRIAVSFINTGVGAVPYVVKAPKYLNVVRTGGGTARRMPP